MVEPMTGSPYVATVYVATKLSGPHGSTVRSEKTWLKMRDSAGRTREESSGVGPEGRRQINVDDPVSHCHFHWYEPLPPQTPQVANVVCHSRTMTITGTGSKLAEYTSPMREMRANVHIGDGANEREGQEIIRTEPLGKRKINGVEAYGQRVTTILPVGPSPIVGETWWSEKLQELVLFDTPGQTMGLRNFKRTEPDAALFYPPSGYSIET